MARITAALRCHWPFLLIVPLIIIVMTWPTLRYVFDLNTLWLPSDDIDLRLKFWDAWHFGSQVFAGKADFYYTNYLFYPKGISLVYHNFSIPHLLVMLAAQLVLPPTNAFNLSTLLVILANAAACYVYILYLFRDRWLSLFGSVLFAASVFVIVRPGQTSVYTIAAIPLAFYCLQRGLDERRNRLIVLAGILAGVTAFTGLYIFVCLLISLGIFVLFQLPTHWKTRQFWLSMLLLSAVAAPISALRVYPMMSDEAALDEALQKGGGREHGGDLLDNFIHRENVITEFVFDSLLREPVPSVREDGYLGFVALGLAAFGLLNSKPSRRNLLWFVLFLTFFVLKLGPFLIVNGRTYADIILPKYHLNNIFPAVFRGFWITAYFHVGLLLPLAILAVFGLRRLLAVVPARAGVIVFIACLAFNFLETIEPPDSTIVPTQRLDYIDWLRNEDGQDELRLINVPFGRAPSKHYALYHAFGGFAHAEGGASRMPAIAFSYIEENALLSAWQNDEGMLCLPFNEGAFNHALNQLLTDGFTHLVYHSDAIRQIGFANFSVMAIEPAYHDDYVRVYRLRDLRNICRESAFFSSNVVVQLASNLPTSTEPGGNIDAPGSSSAALPPLALSLSADGIVQGAPISLASDIDVGFLLQEEGIVLLVLYPPNARADQIETSAGRLSKTFKSCGRAGRAGAAFIEYFTRAEIPCALLVAEDTLTASYDNGVILANVLLQTAGDSLNLYTLWNTLPEDAHAVSIQAFNSAGEKAAGSDFTFRHDSISTHSLDLSSLEPGDYSVKLILYNYQTGVSVPGIVTGSQTRFDRALEIGQITI